jgi:YVTN family beta-propeller protein
MLKRAMCFRRTLLIGSTAVLCFASQVLAQPFLYTASRTSRVTVLNAATLVEIARIELPAAQMATDVALGFEDRRLYVTTAPRPGSPAAGSLVVVDTLANTIVHTLPLAQGARAVTVSRDGQRVFVCRDPATVTIVRATDIAVVGEIPVGGQPSDALLTPDQSALYIANSESNNVSVIDMVKLTPATIAVGTRPVHLAVSPDGRQIFVANNGSNSLSVIDTASRMVTETLTVDVPTADGPPMPSALGFSPDGAKLYVGDSRFGIFGQTGPVRVMNTATRTFTATNLTTRGYDVAVDGTAMRAYFYGSNSNTLDTSQIRVLDMTTDTAAGNVSLDAVGSGSIALGNPAGCAFQISPKLAQFGPAGGTATIDVPAPAGCSWTVGASTAWITVSTTSGSGPSTVTYNVAANGGEPRSATVTIAGQAVQVRQTLPQTWIDEPVAGSTLNQPVLLRGWAIDRDDTQIADIYGGGVDAVHVWAYPVTGAAPTFLGQAGGQARPDLAAAYGEKYSGSGFTLTIRGLASGTYTIVAYAHSKRTGAFTPRTVTVSLTANATPVGVMDAPRDGDEVTQPFLLAGWAADLARASGTGVDAVHVYAYPETGGAPVFVGAAQYGTWARPDVAAYFNDNALIPSGFIMLVNGLAIGRYQLVAFAHSTVTGQFFARTLSVNLIGSSEAIMQVDIATPMPDRRIGMLGWAVDRRATSGNGISALHFWAYPDNGSAPVFLGNIGPPSTDRDVPRLLLGGQFAQSGWSFTSPPLASGGYRLVVYALSGVTGSFDAVRVVRVVVP